MAALYPSAVASQEPLPAMPPMSEERYRTHNENAPDILAFRTWALETVSFDAYVQMVMQDFVGAAGLTNRYTPDDILNALRHYKTPNVQGLPLETPADLVIDRNPQGVLWSIGIPSQGVTYHYLPAPQVPHIEETRSGAALAPVQPTALRFVYRTPPAHYTVDDYNRYLAESTKRPAAPRAAAPVTIATPERNRVFSGTNLGLLIHREETPIDRDGTIIGFSPVLTVAIRSTEEAFGASLRTLTFGMHQNATGETRVKMEVFRDAENSQASALGARYLSTHQIYRALNPFYGVALQGAKTNGVSDEARWHLQAGAGLVPVKRKIQTGPLRGAAVQWDVSLWPGLVAAPNASPQLALLPRASLEHPHHSLRVEPIVDFLHGKKGIQAEYWHTVWAGPKSAVNLGFSWGAGMSTFNPLLFSRDTEGLNVNVQYWRAGWDVTGFAGLRPHGTLGIGMDIAKSTQGHAAKTFIKKGPFFIETVALRFDGTLHFGPTFGLRLPLPVPSPARRAAAKHTALTKNLVHLPTLAPATRAATQRLISTFSTWIAAQDAASHSRAKRWIPTGLAWRVDIATLLSRNVWAAIPLPTFDPTAVWDPTRAEHESTAFYAQWQTTWLEDPASARLTSSERDSILIPMEDLYQTVQAAVHTQPARLGRRKRDTLTSSA